jgi:hypothetical protein
MIYRRKRAPIVDGIGDIGHVAGNQPDLGFYQGWMTLRISFTVQLLWLLVLLFQSQHPQPYYSSSLAYST